MKHTPGPWTAISSDRGVLIDSPTVMVAKVPFSGDQAEADGQLIAAAPDLLEALKRVLNDFSGGKFEVSFESIKQASDAVFKATGSVK